MGGEEKPQSVSRFELLSAKLENAGYIKVSGPDEEIEYSLWDSPNKGNHGFPKITKDIMTGKQTYRVLTPDLPDWSKTHWEIREIKAKEIEEATLQAQGYTRIRDVSLHVAEFRNSSQSIRLCDVDRIGFYVDTQIPERDSIQNMLGVDKFDGSYDDFIFGQPWRKVNELRGKQIQESSADGVTIKQISDGVFSISGKAPDNANLTFYLKSK